MATSRVRRGYRAAQLFGSEKMVEAIMREDPFCKNGLAEFRVIEFRASQRADDIPKRVEGSGAKTS